MGLADQHPVKSTVPRGWTWSGVLSWAPRCVLTLMYCDDGLIGSFLIPHALAVGVTGLAVGLARSRIGFAARPVIAGRRSF